VRLLLTSAGVTNTSIHNALVDLLGKPIAESSAVCIPTATHALGKPELAWRFISGEEPRTPMCELGWTSLGVLELTALPSIDEERWFPWVQETDVLLVNGGDPLYLCYWMRQSGLADLLPSLRAVYVGLSAGSMVMAPNIGDDFVKWKPSTGGDERWAWSAFRCFRTWITRTCPRTPGPTQKSGPPACRFRRTRSTIRPPSRWSTTPSKSSPRGTGSCSPPSTKSLSGGLSIPETTSPRVLLEGSAPLEECACLPGGSRLNRPGGSAHACGTHGPATESRLQ